MQLWRLIKEKALLLAKYGGLASAVIVVVGFFWFSNVAQENADEINFLKIEMREHDTAITDIKIEVGYLQSAVRSSNEKYNFLRERCGVK